MAGGWGGKTKAILERDRSNRYRDLDQKSDLTLPYLTLNLLIHFIYIIITFN